MSDKELTPREELDAALATAVYIVLMIAVVAAIPTLILLWRLL